ncbi:MAG: glycosyltransferase family 2 protein [Halioglobus sp.]
MNSSPNPIRLSVSLVVYHSDLPRLLQTVDSLCESIRHAAAEGNLRASSLVLVDNSEDDAYATEVGEAVSRAVSSCPQLAFTQLRAESNLGYGAAHNLATRELDSDLHLVLNPDVELAVDSLALGIDDLVANSSTALLAPRVLSGNGEQEFLCRRYPSVLVLVLRAFAPRFIQSLFSEALADYEMRDICLTEQRAVVPLASGCFMLLRTAALQAVQGFDSRYFLYFEDYDLCQRLAAEGELVFQPRMSIVHHGGYAARKGAGHVGMFIRSGLRFFRQYGWRWI